MSRQSKLSTKRSSEEVKINGRRKTKLKYLYRYKEEWYLECGNKYNDNDDVHDESEIDYNMIYEALKIKVIYGHFQCDTVTNKYIMITCCDINLTGCLYKVESWSLIWVIRSYILISWSLVVTYGNFSVSKLKLFF